MNVEIFSCSGGMAEGFRRAGVAFDLVIDRDPDAVAFDLVIDRDPDAVASYSHNLGHRPVQLDVNDFARLVVGGWRPPRPIDLLVADPPCTPWSRAGKRLGLGDARDCLAVTAELIGLLRPRAYLVGNIPGLQDAPSWHVAQKVIGGLSVHGYCVIDYKRAWQRDLAKGKELTSEAQSERDAARREAGELRARICTVADEANGPHQVMWAEQAMAEIERALFERRQSEERWRARAERLEGFVRDLLTVHVTGAYVSDGCFSFVKYLRERAREVLGTGETG